MESMLGTRGSLQAYTYIYYIFVIDSGFAGFDLCAATYFIRSNPGLFEWDQSGSGV